MCSSVKTCRLYLSKMFSFQAASCTWFLVKCKTENMIFNCLFFKLIASQKPVSLVNEGSEVKLEPYLAIYWPLAVKLMFFSTCHQSISKHVTADQIWNRQRHTAQTLCTLKVPAVSSLWFKKAIMVLNYAFGYSDVNVLLCRANAFSEPRTVTFPTGASGPHDLLYDREQLVLLVLLITISFVHILKIVWVHLTGPWSV